MSILVRQIAKKNRVNDKIRDEIVTKHVKAGNTSTKTVMQELSGYWSSALSHLVHAALKSQLFRANLKENPRPPHPLYTGRFYVPWPAHHVYSDCRWKEISRQAWLDGRDSHKVDVSLAVRLGMWCFKDTPCLDVGRTTSASHLATGYLDFPAKLLYPTSPSH